MQRKPRKFPFNSPRATSHRPTHTTQRSDQPSKAGIIDQKLIQGAQVVRNFDQSRRNDVERHPEPPSRIDDDVELDAFGE